MLSDTAIIGIVTAVTSLIGTVFAAYFALKMAQLKTDSDNHSKKLDANTAVTEATSKQLVHVTDLVNSQDSKREEEKKILIQNVVELKDKLSLSVMKDTIREALAPAAAPALVAPAAAPVPTQAPVPVVIENKAPVAVVETPAKK